MKCIFCNLKKGPFESEKIYRDFKCQISFLVKENSLVQLGEVDPDGPFVIIKYRCTMCNKIWVLEVPDQAFRGGWYEE